MHPLIIGGLVSWGVNLIIGFSVFFNNIKGEINRKFLFLSVCIGSWSFGSFFLNIIPDKNIAIWFLRLSYLFAVLLIPAFLSFVSTLTQGLVTKRILAISKIYSVFLLFTLPTRLFIKTIYVLPKDNLLISSPGPIYYIFVAGFGATAYIGFSRLILAIKASLGIRRTQLMYISIAYFIACLAGLDYFMSVFKIFKGFPIDDYILLFSFSILAYAILRYRLLEVKVAAARATIFIVIYLLILGIPFIVASKYQSVLIGFLKGVWWILPLIIMAILASAGPFIYSYLRQKAEQRLRKEEFEAHQALNKLAQNMMRFTKLDKLLKLIAHHVVKIMGVDFAAIYLKDEANRHYLLRASRSIDKASPAQSEFPEDSPLINDILLRKVPVVTEELRLGQTPRISPHFKRLQLELDRSKANVIVPAFKGDYLYGFLMLGQRENNRLFTQEDLNLLLLLANQSVLAIENAQLFEKEKTLLAEKSRRDALADMAPGVAHQFNNRLISISMAAETQLALTEAEDLKTLSQDKLISIIEESKKTFSGVAKDAIRGKDIADAILKKGRAKLTYIKTDLSPIIQSSIDLLKMSRTQGSLEGAHEPETIILAEENLPQLTLNESLIQDVFYNLIDNARDAIIIMHRAIRENKITPQDSPYKGKITITLAKKDNKVVVTVEDNGIGMDEKTKARLFVPYFTTKATSLKGTGMGLWVIRSFIEDHKAKISVESEYAKGATFTITFPIKEA